MNAEGRAAATTRRRLQLCREGKEPAEVLSTQARAYLVRDLVDRGWTDVEIAVITRMTLYTTARIRTRLRLKANQSRAEVAAR